MKGRESGMPDEDYWNSFFDAEYVLRKLFGEEGCRGDVVEFGCGYGTFTFPAARHATGTVRTFDIDADLVEGLQRRAREEGFSNIVAEIRDFVAQSTGLGAGSQSHAMIYNLLHIENPDVLIKEAFRVLRPNGRLSVIHWRRDVPTPRGPSLEIRPTPEQCKAWIEAAGFRDVRIIDLEECCPYHFGMLAIR
ncbi:MAG: class I SAM-dependent methyltransferase [Candidatus Hydrogenedentes bacterium]|nr:class I SAM-dependent methyltransferase [Candidatus Hydrogenedentota bacterium]